MLSLSKSIISGVAQNILFPERKAVLGYAHFFSSIRLTRGYKHPIKVSTVTQGWAHYNNLIKKH